MEQQHNEWETWKLKGNRTKKGNEINTYNSLINQIYNGYFFVDDKKKLSNEL